MTIQELAAKALAEQQASHQQWQRDQNEQLAGTTANRAERLLGITVKPNLSDGTAYADGLNFRARHDSDMGDYLEVIADGWPTWRVVWDLADLGEALQNDNLEAQTDENAPTLWDLSEAERITQALELIACHLVDLIDTLRHFETFKPFQP